MLYYSIDNAGNNESVQNLEIKIDKIAPEIQVEFSRALPGFSFSATDDLDPNTSIICSSSLCTATDQAGNETLLEFAKNKVLNVYSLILKSIIRKGVKNFFPLNQFAVNYSLSSGQIKDFSQAVYVNKQQLAAVTYSAKKNLCSIVEWTPQKTFKTYTLPGIHLIQLTTNQNNLNIKIK